MFDTKKKEEVIEVKWTAVSNCLNTKKKTNESIMKTSKLRTLFINYRVYIIVDIHAQLCMNF